MQHGRHKEMQLWECQYLTQRMNVIRTHRRLRRVDIWTNIGHDEKSVGTFRHAIRIQAYSDAPMKLVSQNVRLLVLDCARRLDALFLESTCREACLEIGTASKV